MPPTTPPTIPPVFDLLCAAEVELVELEVVKLEAVEVEVVEFEVVEVVEVEVVDVVEELGATDSGVSPASTAIATFHPEDV